MLKQESQQEPAAVWHTPVPVEADSELAVSLNRTQVEDVLARAERLQSAERERLGLAEIERIAAQRGIEARHIRQALLTAVPLSHNTRQQATTATTGLTKLTAQQKRTIAVTSIAYTMFLIVFMSLDGETQQSLPMRLGMTHDTLAVIVFGAVPALLTLWLGWTTRRPGPALAGASFATAAFAGAAVIPILFLSRQGMNLAFLPQLLFIAAFIAALGSFLSIVGAVACQVTSDYRTRRERQAR